LADTLTERLQLASQDRVVVDLAEVGGELFDPDAERVTALLEAVAVSDLIVVASPTFKATYTGILKSFFDRYGANALAAAVAVPLMTGAAPIHALAPEVHLRPLLVELGASVPTRSLYVTEDRFDDLDSVIGGWADKACPRIERAMSAPDSER
jgi:FMN reductase